MRIERLERDKVRLIEERDHWKRRSEHLEKELETAQRARRRQAAPFAKDRPQGNGRRPGRRAGVAYGKQGRCRPSARVDETHAAPAPTTCPDCGEAVVVTRTASQYQEDLPDVRPFVRRFDVEVGHCSACRRRVQGRHALQTSDALGAAAVQLGPNVAAVVVELQETLSRIARTTIEERDKRQDDEQSTRSMLPTGSRVHYREPINALLFRAPMEEVADFNPTAVTVERKDLGEDDPISIVAFKENAFHVNTLHPYYSAIRKRTGESRAAREFLRAFDLFAISERLLEGHLLNVGISEDEIGEIVAWRESLFRRLAASYEDTPELIGEMFRTSHIGGRGFEKALCAVLEDMGFYVEHDGGSGKKDAFVVATVGPESYSFTVEAKGSGGDVDNATADVGAAANHRDQAGAEHALIIARKFAGFAAKPDRDAALLGECRSTGRVSIMELESLEKIHASVSRFSYPLSLLEDVFTTLETPQDKLARIEGLVTPVEGFNYKKLLHQIWIRQESSARGEEVPYRAVFQVDGWKEQGMNFEDFQRRLVALETLAAGRIQVSTGTREVYLRQSPDLILEQIQKSLQGEGHDVPES